MLLLTVVRGALRIAAEEGDCVEPVGSESDSLTPPPSAVTRAGWIAGPSALPLAHYDPF